MTEKTYTEAEVRVLVAAALQRAAAEIDCGCSIRIGCVSPDGCPKEHVAAVLALIDTDHASIRAEKVKPHMGQIMAECDCSREGDCEVAGRCLAERSG